MENLRSSDYLETCAECEGWDVTIFNEVSSEDRVDFSVRCVDCGCEWEDYELVGEV
jgi:hypothetical protein